VIKAVANDLFVVGLSRANCEKLLERKPIFITPESLDGKLKQAVLILGGETEAAILADLKAHPDVFDLSQAKTTIVLRPGEEDRVKIGLDVFDAATGEKVPEPPAQPATPEERSHALVHRLTELAAAAEAEMPDGLRVALFAYEPTPAGEPGEVAHISRDRELTAAAVRRWLNGAFVAPPKASA
jgi:hypothetical protein